jgi:hypothetical protein
VSTHYRLDAVAIQDGQVTRLREPEASFWTYNSTVQEILWPVIERMNVKPLTHPFPWFENRDMYDGSNGDKPRPDHCFSPDDILRDVKWIEAEVSKHPRRYPAMWSFEVPASADRPSSTHTALHAFYNGRAVVLYGEDKKCWAKETTPGPREGIHHQLDGSIATVSLTADGPPVQVAIKRAPLSTQFHDVMGASSEFASTPSRTKRSCSHSTCIDVLGFERDNYSRCS